MISWNISNERCTYPQFVTSRFPRRYKFISEMIMGFDDIYNYKNVKIFNPAVQYIIILKIQTFKERLGFIYQALLNVMGFV